MDFFRRQFFQMRKNLLDRGLYDSRLVVLVLVGLIAISVFWNGAQIVQQNYELAQKVAEIEQENAILELENRNKELQNEYLGTEEFAEITARRVFGRAAPGETVYIVPKQVALGALETQQVPEESDVNQIEKPSYQRNFESWLDIYFGN